MNLWRNNPLPRWLCWLQFLWRGRWIYLQLGLVAAAIWLVAPLNQAIRLPNPPLPAYTPEPPERQAAWLLAPDTFIAGSRAAARVVVSDPDLGQPLAGVQITIGLAGPLDALPLFVGSTDALGTAQAAFDLPPDISGTSALVVDVTGAVGTQRIVHPINLHRSLQLDLSTGQAVYRPGQTIYLRLLTLDGSTGLPLAAQPVSWAISAPNGARLAQGRAVTSHVGVAVARFTLADRIMAGSYRILAQLGDQEVERTVEVQAN